MDTGTIIMWIVGGFLLLVILFLPLITRSSAKPTPASPRDKEREEAYRRGLMIGSLMEVTPETPGASQQQRIEQAMLEQQMIEHYLHHDEK